MKEKSLHVDGVALTGATLVSALIAAGFDEVSSEQLVIDIFNSIEEKTRTEADAISLIKRLTGLSVISSSVTPAQESAILKLKG